MGLDHRRSLVTAAECNVGKCEERVYCTVQCSEDVW